MPSFVLASDYVQTSISWQLSVASLSAASTDLVVLLVWLQPDEVFHVKLCYCLQSGECFPGERVREAGSVVK